MVLVFVLRKLITLMRRLGFGRILPLDHSIHFHEQVGRMIALYSMGHAVCHVANVINLGASWSDVACILFTTNFDGNGLVRGAPIITGWILSIVLAVMVASSLSAVRRSGHFEVFFNLHRLYIVYFILLVLHGPRFWQWLVLPGTLFFIELMARIKAIVTKYGRTNVKRVELFKGDTLALTIAKPRGFRYRCGDYLYLNVPEISKYEWHAFTISSAPEFDHLTLHIRVVGEWTRHLQQKNEAAREREEMKSNISLPSCLRHVAGRTSVKRRSTINYSRKRNVGSGDSDSQPLVPAITDVARATSDRLPQGRPSTQENISFEDSTEALDENEMIVNENFEVLIDGPYAAPSSDFSDSSHPVFVATGIGVTPFISIMQSIIWRYIAIKTQCPHCHRSLVASKPRSLETLNRVDFIWIVRDFAWVTWFKTILRDLMQNQDQYGDILKGLIRIKIFVTSANEKVSVNNLLLKIALEKENARKDQDLRKLRSNVELGRPNWDRILQQVRREDQDATVLFCGPEVLAKDLEIKCSKFGVIFRKEVF